MLGRIRRVLLRVSIRGFLRVCTGDMGWMDG